MWSSMKITLTLKVIVVVVFKIFVFLRKISNPWLGDNSGTKQSKVKYLGMLSLIIEIGVS